jgi:hypothetical protein
VYVVCVFCKDCENISLQRYKNLSHLFVVSIITIFIKETFVISFSVCWRKFAFQVADFSLSSFLGHLESPLKPATTVPNTEDTRLLSDVSKM